MTGSTRGDEEVAPAGGPLQEVVDHRLGHPALRPGRIEPQDGRRARHHHQRHPPGAQRGPGRRLVEHLRP